MIEALFTWAGMLAFLLVIGVCLLILAAALATVVVGLFGFAMFVLHAFAEAWR